jgi:predicted nucleic acid-binding protein
MKIHELTNHYKKKCNKYSSESTNLNNIVNENYKYQIIDPKRLNNYVTYSELVERREMLNDMFLNNDTLTNTQLYYLNMKHLILSVYTMQPPLRHEYKDLIILNMAYNTQSNYIVNDDNKFIIYINNDKVIRSHGNIKLHLCDELNKIILRSLKHFPRTFLFSNFKDYTQPIGKQGLENLIKSCFDDKKINVDIIRSAYITHFYNNKKMNIHEKEILAIHMRHSVTTAERVYRKIVLDD